MADPVPTADPFPRQRVRLGREGGSELELAVVDVGHGDPIVFLHGNPTSSHLWRNVLPHVRDLGRCLAPDLLGMGESSKLPHPGPGSYSFARHAEVLAHFLEEVGVTERVVLVGSEWGSALAFDWARQHPGAVRGIAFMEPVVQPVLWADVPDDTKRLYQELRGQDGEQHGLQENRVVEELLPASVLRGLPAETLDRYRRPYPEPADRWPTLEWTRQLPIDHAPPAVHDVLDQFLEKIEATERVVLVGSEWGSALAFDWAREHPAAVRGVAFMEPVVQPVIWADVPDDTKRLLQVLRGPDGEHEGLERAAVVEELLPSLVRRGLSPTAHDRYRAPYRQPADRWPTLEWARQLPVDHAPPAVHDVIDRAGQWMARSEVPKLFVDTEPAVPRSYRMRRVVRRWPALTEVTLPAGRLVAEDTPDELGRAVADWITTLA